MNPWTPETPGPLIIKTVVSLRTSLYAICLMLLASAGARSQRLRFEALEPAATGITWIHDKATSEAHYLPETMGAGVALLDFDGDGLLDLYLVNSGPSDFFQPASPLRNALYRNNGDGTFADVTMEAGVAGGSFGMGAAVGDYDNDGDPDLFITSYGDTLLYRNEGNGRFAEVGVPAGVRRRGWTTSAAWFDYDQDGWLDLFVASFVKFSKEEHISCGLNPLGKAYYCVPRVFDATASYLFSNKRNGTFDETGASTAIGQTLGKALGVVAADVNNDSRLDLFVANDTVQDFLFLNRGEGDWEEVGLFAGVGFSATGDVQSGMGVDAADFDEDGFQDLFVSNIDHQNYSLFRNLGDETFQDVGLAQGVWSATFNLSGWGLKFFDIDNDSDLDLLLVNGHPDDMISEYAEEVSYREPLILFEQQDGKLRDVSLRGGPIFSRPISGRGMAVGDIDNDGRPDVLVSASGEPPLLLRNTSEIDSVWLGLRLVGLTCNRDAVGAQISWISQGKRYHRWVNGGGSYLSAHDLRQVLGFGEKAPDWIEVAWPRPSTRIERFDVLALNRYVVLEEGTGTVVP